MLLQCQLWYIDGTFKTVPPLFKRLYTAHGVKYNNAIPSVFALLPDKTEASYNK